ncbi:MAG: protein-L-isoaspartate(D-aspartate) O-methyltransferase [Candidatus Theseobacter exili]|nr:protein-L-isoaspartate(D-aspartate) O-methyltransferase [Candidatus Theseobacter exili]
MNNYKDKRNSMVETQLILRGIKDESVLNAMRVVPRDKFVKTKEKNHAYEDHPLPIGHGQTISQPYMVAYMTELLELKGDERVLEIGTGSGYQTAVLSELAKEVYTIDRIKILSEEANAVLDELGYKNIRFLVGDGTKGWQEQAPFDGVIVTAGAPDLPVSFMEQLADGGILVIPVGRSSYQVLTVIKKTGNNIIRKECLGCMFVPLIGEYGWKKD